MAHPIDATITGEEPDVKLEQDTLGGTGSETHDFILSQGRYVDGNFTRHQIYISEDMLAQFQQLLTLLKPQRR